MSSAMLSAAIKPQYSSVFPLRHCLPVIDEICGTTMDFEFFRPRKVIKIANTPPDRSAALVLSVIN